MENNSPGRRAAFSKMLSRDTRITDKMVEDPAKSVKRPQDNEHGYVLGIDGGGTKTVALAADSQGNVLGWGTSGASITRLSGWIGLLPL